MLEPADLERHEQLARAAGSRWAGLRGAGPADQSACGSTRESRSARPARWTAAASPASIGRVSASRSATVLAAANARFVDRDLERLFERHHQLDAFERAEAELVDRRGRRDGPPRREPLQDRRDAATAGVLSAFGLAAVPASA